MSRRRVAVVAMRSWGEFGNRLAAERIRAVLIRQLPSVEISVWDAEDLVPKLEDAGREIRKITLGTRTVAQRSSRYMALMRRLARDFPPGFELRPPAAFAFRAELAALSDRFDERRLDLVIGTKGLISRLCLAAVRNGRGRTNVANYVTNPGLLELSIHRSAHMVSVVPFAWARSLLRAEPGFDPDRVVVTGPLIAEHELGGLIARPAADGDAALDNGPALDMDGRADPERPFVIVFCNRGGEPYLRVVRRLAAADTDIDLVFVGHRDEELTRAVRNIARDAGRDRWRFHHGLSQAEYFGYVRRAARCRHSMLISKAGPNTVLEAVFHGIPVLALDSGLPIERWVRRLIEDEAKVGRWCRTTEELLSAVEQWLTRPALIADRKHNSRIYATSVLDQVKIAGRLRETVLALLERRPMPRWE